MSKVVEFPRSPMERLGLTEKDFAAADEIEQMLGATFGNDPEFELYAVSLLMILVVQLRRRVTELEALAHPPLGQDSIYARLEALEARFAQKEG